MLEECFTILIEQLVTGRIMDWTIFANTFELDVCLGLDVGIDVLEDVLSFCLLDDDGEFAELKVVNVSLLQECDLVKFPL